MDRRTLIIAGVSFVGGSITGCLENGEPMDDTTDSEGNASTTDSADGHNGKTRDNYTDDTPTDRNSPNGTGSIQKTQFEVLDSALDFEVTASVTFKNDSIYVSGTIQGNNTCYTAKLDDVTVENRTLILNIISYEDADENEVCGLSLIGIEYRVVVTFGAALPTEVTVEHNDEPVTSQQSS